MPKEERAHRTSIPHIHIRRVCAACKKTWEGQVAPSQEAKLSTLIFYCQDCLEGVRK